MEKVGIIDLGSNTARLVIVDMFADGHYMVVDELKESVRLGQDMDRDGFLKPQRIPARRLMISSVVIPSASFATP